MKVKTIHIKLVTASPFRVGGARDPLHEIDNPIVMIGNKIVIPGSTIKGALRSQLEEYFSTTLKIPPCLPTERPSEAEESLIRNGKYRRSCKPFYSSEALRDFDVCPVCYFLGAQGLVGFVRVSFFELESNSRPEKIINIGIDRYKKTAREGALFESELIPQNAIFRGKVEVVEKDETIGWEFGKPRKINGKVIDKWLEEFSKGKKEEEVKKELFDILKTSLKNIRLLGGYKSKGFGEVKIEIIEEN